MCGFIGFLSLNGSLPRHSMSSGLRQLVNRGPDAFGEWIGDGVYLGHRRLAILDIDARSNQPFLSDCSRYAIVFNGEIYNYLSLRDKLLNRGIILKTNSDTEVLLYLYILEGEQMLAQLRGMFAFVVFDNFMKRAFVARDPYGIKPLFYSQQSEGFIFSSQVRAILETGLVSKDPCPVGQAGFWMLGSIPEPNTWFEHIKSFPVGSYAYVDNGHLGEINRWWDISDCWRSSLKSDSPDDHVYRATKEALMESVAAHLVSDVPIGIFLSGGIDSGALAGLISDLGVRNLHGVTLAYEEFLNTPNDEAPLAAKLASHYGINHHVRYVRYDEFLSDLPGIISAMDQPSIDGVNTWYASKGIAELGLKVVISGVGGDELFQGYGSFRDLPRLVSRWSALNRLPGVLSLARASASLQAWRTGNQRWHHFPDWAGSIEGAWWLRRGLFSPLELPKLMGEELAAEGLAGFSPRLWLSNMSGQLPNEGILAVGQIESTTYLRNQLLRDSDWASMYHSVELRTPLVDAWLLRDLQPYLGSFYRFPNKRLLAEAPNRKLPVELITRKKTGFGIPVKNWLSTGSGKKTNRGGPSQAWARELVGLYEASI